MEVFNDVFCSQDIARLIIGAIFDLTVGVILIFIDHKYKRRRRPKRTKELIESVNEQIMNRLYFFIENKKVVDKYLILRVRYLHATSSHLQLKDIIKEDEILENLITYITASPYFTKDEKVKMVKQAYSNADCFHWEPVKKAVFHIVGFLVVFSLLYGTLHIAYFYKIIAQLFLSYTEWIIIPLLAIFSALISHYIYIAYIQYKSLKQIKTDHD